MKHRSRHSFTTKALTALGVGSIVAASVATAFVATAADHLDAPGAQADGRTDINDVYAFQSPTNADNTVLIMTVNPVAGALSGTTFHPKATYAFNIDDDGDAVADTMIDVTFGKVKQNGRQDVRVTLEGPDDSKARASGRVGRDFRFAQTGRVVAGVYDDPFFFDLEGFRNEFQFTGVNFFAELNVSAIVVEVPSALLGDEGIGVWATTAIDDQVIDQMGRPAVNTALIAADRKDAFNQTPPSEQWAAFGTEVTEAIAGLSGDAEYAKTIAPVLIPDILTFEIGNGDGFLNGRQLADDVIDAELSLLTNGALTTDNVANDSAFLTEFPYLAPAY